ncbi:MAG: hypothetical protein IPH13_14895 [Planctomycetes bacterium]|nr:hypothetical protein [Planctomycetota bacterium]MCC7170978.1 hypothetical protein [Planctomycetota bacterium]
MTARFACVVAGLLMATAGCERQSDPVSTSLYHGPIAGLPVGIVASIRLDLERFSYARMLELDLGDAAVLHVFELDRNAAGGGRAAVLSGPGAAELEGVLLERGYITRIDDDGSIVIGGGSAADGFPSVGMLLAAGAIAPRPLRRFEADGRIVFSPTVDMKHDLLDLDAAATADLEQGPEIAIAFNGARLARTLKSRMSDALGPLGEMAAVEVSRRARGRRSMRSPTDMAFGWLEGIRVAQISYSADRGHARIVVGQHGDLAPIVAALRDVAGEWPLDDEGGLKFAFACDVEQWVAALAERTGYRDDVDVEGMLGRWDGRLSGTFALDRMEFSRLAIGQSSTADATQADWSPFEIFGIALAGTTVEAGGWLHRPAPPPTMRWGPLDVEAGTFLHLRDGKLPTERARTLLTGKRVAEHTIELDWYGLTP